MIKTPLLPVACCLTLFLAGCLFDTSNATQTNNTPKAQANAFCAVYGPSNWTFKTKNVEQADLYDAMANNARSAVQAPELKAVFKGYVESEAGTDFSDFIEQGFSQVLEQPWQCEPMRTFEKEMALLNGTHDQSTAQTDSPPVKIVINQKGLSINNAVVADLSSESISSALSIALKSAKNTDLIIEVLEPNKPLFDQLLAEAGKLRIQRISLVEH